eukprot:354837-Chlamydomonas_euryale.AAC.11
MKSHLRRVERSRHAGQNERKRGKTAPILRSMNFPLPRDAKGRDAAAGGADGLQPYKTSALNSTVLGTLSVPSSGSDSDVACPNKRVPSHFAGPAHVYPTHAPGCRRCKGLLPFPAG